MNSQNQLERYARESVAARHHEAERHRRLRAARRAHHRDTARDGGLRHAVARLLRAAAARIEPRHDVDPGHDPDPAAA